MKKISIFPSVAALFLTAVFPGGAFASLTDAVRGEPPVSAFKYSMRVAAETPVQIESAAGVSGKPVPLKIGAPANGAENYRFVMVHGLPEAVTLSAGFRVRQSWFIAIKDIAGVQLVSSAQYNGNFMLEFFFFKDSQKPPAVSTVVNVRIDADKDSTQEARGEQTLTAAPPVKLDNSDGLGVFGKRRTSPAVFSPAQEAEMLGKGEEYMRIGDVASARLLFEDLAAHGSAGGMLAMGRSYDPNFLTEILAAGTLQPNIAKAKLWYQRASDIGDSDAQDRLTALGAR